MPAPPFAVALRERLTDARPVECSTPKQMAAARYGLGVMAGLCWAAAFPKWDIAGLAWIAPGLILLATAGASPRVMFRVGYTAGVAHYLAGLYWILCIPVGFYPILGWLALAFFLALYPAIWARFCWSRLASRSVPGGGSLLQCATDRVAGTTWGGRTAWALMAAAAWVTWEMIQARLFSGFPWNLLGASQSKMLLITQVARFAGVFGISFLVVWGSASLLMGVLVLLHSPDRRNAWQREVALPFLAVLGLSVWGWTRVVSPAPPPGRTLDIALVQPSIPQTMIWDDRESNARFAKLLQLSRTALASRPDLLVWPEAALPYPIRYDTETSDAVASLLKGGRTWLALGSDDAEVQVDAGGQRRTNYYNSAFLLNPSGGIEATYRKRQLVIFGEYVPLLRWLPFLKWFTPITGGFTPGERRVGFQIGEPKARFAPLICFEDMFAGLVRDQSQQEVEFLLNLTNDGWFGESAQQWQHAANASLRAIETGLPLVRCANNGISCWVDATGRILSAQSPGFTSEYGEGVKRVRLPIASPGPWTFYRRFGDLFGWACVAWVVGGIASAAWGRRQGGIRGNTSGGIG
ncbi:MAG TPA: apolipoprotein N-acyltransferase [Verrucomicrobiales bacterium]|nr:apolipoprotein N-acyltransferase [Verrucomicrobiales bacterium]